MMEDAAEMYSLCLLGTFRENCEDLLLIDQGFCNPVNAKADLEDVVLERPDAAHSGCCSLRNRVVPPKASPAQDLGSHMAAAPSVGPSPAPQHFPVPSHPPCHGTVASPCGAQFCLHCQEPLSQPGYLGKKTVENSE